MSVLQFRQLTEAWTRRRVKLRDESSGRCARREAVAVVSRSRQVTDDFRRMDDVTAAPASSAAAPEKR